MTGPSHLPTRIPILPTLLVILAALTMIGLGIWQLERRAEKRDAIALAAANPQRPSVAFPMLPPIAPDLLFRRSSVHCLRVVDWRVEAGRAADGSTGYRHIARCATGAEGPGVMVALGVGQKPDQAPAWNGGQVEGWISQEPDHRPLLARIGGPADPDFVDWMTVDRVEGREYDIGIHRHWLDPTRPLAETAQAHIDLEARKTTGSTVLLP